MNIVQKIYNKASNLLSTKKGSYTGLTGFNMGFGFDNYVSKESINNGYGVNDTLYSIIKKTSTTIASNIIWKVKEIDLRTGEMEEVYDTELNSLLNFPNKYQSQNEFREQIYNYLLLTGRSFIGGVKPVGFKEYNSLHNLPSDKTTFTLGDLTQPYKEFLVDWNFNKKWDGEDVLFNKYVNMVIKDEHDLFDGQSPLMAGDRLRQTSNHSIEAQASYFKNRGVSSLLTNRSDEILMPAEKEKLQSVLDKNLGGANQFNKVKLTSANVELIKLGLDPSELKMLEFGVQDLRRWTNLYSLDSSLFNDPANKTFNNRKEALKDAYTSVYIPNDKKIVDGLNHWLSPNFMTAPGKKLIIEQDYSHIEVLQSDKKQEAEKDKIVMDGVNVVLNMPISNEAKINILINQYDFSIDDAEIIVSSGSKNASLEKLKSMSPLLANKILEKLSEEEVRALLS